MLNSKIYLGGAAAFLILLSGSAFADDAERLDRSADQLREERAETHAAHDKVERAMRSGNREEIDRAQADLEREARELKNSREKYIDRRDEYQDNR